VIGWISIVVFAGLAALATRNVVGLWHGTSREWRWSDRWVRGFPAAVAVGWSFLVGAVLGVIGMSLSGAAADIVAVLLLAVLLFLMASAVVWVAVLAVNRPSFAVPPHLRSHRRA
jgi:hypothetical protein